MKDTFWDNRYAEKAYAYGKMPNQSFKDFLTHLKPGIILLPGEGEGRNAVYAALKGWTVEAVDQSKEGRKKALSLARLNNVTFKYYLRDMYEFDFTLNKYDAIAMIFFHLPPSIRIQIHKKVMDSLKPGGYLMIEAFSKEQVRNASGGPKEPELLYDKQMLENDFKLMKIIEITETTTELDEGPFHQGQASVVRLIGMKV